jgi:hypothetical protein
MKKEFYPDANKNKLPAKEDDGSEGLEVHLLQRKF